MSEGISVLIASMEEKLAQIADDNGWQEMADGFNQALQMVKAFGARSKASRLNGIVLIGRSAHRPVTILQETPGTTQVQESQHSSPYWEDANKVTKLKDNETFVSVQWAGGWDEYAVDLSTVRKQTPEEMALKINPLTRDNFIRGQFCKLISSDECVKIVRKFGGGD